jgi:hypothetical protein
MKRRLLILLLIASVTVSAFGQTGAKRGARGRLKRRCESERDQAEGRDAKVMKFPVFTLL